MSETEDFIKQYVRNGAYLTDRDFPPLRWAVPQIIPEGFGLFTGPPKVGKSWAVLGMALALASGGQAFGSITCERRRVLYLALEDGERRLQERCRILLQGQDIPKAFHYVTTADRDHVMPTIEQWLQRFGSDGPMVALDTLGKVMPDQRRGESPYARDYRIGSELKAMSDDATGSSLIAVTHTRKAQAEDWMDSTSGTQGLNGSADFTVNLARSRNEAGGLLRVTGRDVEENEYALVFEQGAWRLQGDSLAQAMRNALVNRMQAGLGDRSIDVLRVVAAHPQGVSPTAVGKTLGMDMKDAHKYMSRLVDSGRLRKSGRGVYVCVDSVDCVDIATDLSSVSLLGEGTKVDTIDAIDTYTAQARDIDFRNVEER